VRNVFSVDEIRALREMAVESRKHPGDLLSNKSLSHIVTDAKVLEIARSILGGDPVYPELRLCAVVRQRCVRRSG
jgi:hypothetical protein